MSNSRSSLINRRKRMCSYTMLAFIVAAGSLLTTTVYLAMYLANVSAPDSPTEAAQAAYNREHPINPIWITIPAALTVICLFLGIVGCNLGDRLQRRINASEALLNDDDIQLDDDIFSNESSSSNIVVVANRRITPVPYTNTAPLTLLEEFEAAGGNRNDLPDWIIDCVTQEIMDNPVILIPSGRIVNQDTYDNIMTTGDKKCPISRVPLTDCSTHPDLKTNIDAEREKVKERIIALKRKQAEEKSTAHVVNIHDAQAANHPSAIFTNANSARDADNVASSSSADSSPLRANI